jgi:uncharacterized membrane protein YkoI
MKNKLIIITIVFMTAFLVIIGTGVITNVRAKSSAVAPTATQDLSAFLAREKQYQQLINEANQKIDQANQQITNLVNNTPQPEPTNVPEYLFTADQASALAANLAGDLPEKAPELVNFDGVIAYEVQYSNGKIYIDANTGKMIYNGLQASNPYITTDQAEAIALNYLGSGTITQVTMGVYENINVYIVQFSNGQSVYVDLYGRVVAVQMASTTKSNNPPPEEEEGEGD